MVTPEKNNNKISLIRKYHKLSDKGKLRLDGGKNLRLILPFDFFGSIFYLYKSP